ncbi:MAG: TadE/TadG family type IV pilus assembly protein [Anaerolineae bacterium]
MKFILNRQKRNTERGQSLTELALLLPFLLMLILGTLDLSRAYEVYVDVTNAAREGARYAAGNATDSTIQTDVTTRVNQELTGAGIGSVTVAALVCTSYSTNSVIACSSAASGDYITVSVSTQFQFVTFSVIGLSTTTISNSATMAVVLP